MNRTVFILISLLFPIALAAHPDWKDEFKISEPIEFVGNVRAFVADSANVDYSGGGGQSWHGVQVRIELPDKYEGKWVTFLYKEKPKLSSGKILELGDYVQFKIDQTEWLHLDKTKEFRILSQKQFNEIFQASHE
jgi:hypothetical protein